MRRLYAAAAKGKGVLCMESLLPARPLCLMAAVLVFFLLLYLKEDPEQISLSQELTLRCTGRVVNKELKESYGSSYWQVTMDRVSVNSKKEILQELGEETLELLEEGKLLCSLQTEEEEPVIGHRLTVQGKLRAWEEASNPGQFDFGKWYRTKGIAAQLWRAEVVPESEIPGASKAAGLPERLWQLRRWADTTLKACLGEEDGALISAMVVGEKGGLTEETKTLYQKNGISHILSISGLHLMLLGMGLYKALQRLGCPMVMAVSLSMGIMAVYCIFTGSSVSTVRATLMFCSLLLARLIGRSYDSLSALGLAAILQLILNPWSLMDSGFQLSYLAVVGVSAVVPRLNQCFSPNSKLIKSILVSVGVGLATLPVLLYQFGTYPWHSIVLNLFVVPVMAALLWLALLLLVLAALFSPALFLCRVLAWIIKGILFYYELCCRLFERLPVWGGYQGRPFWLCILFFYLGVILLLWLPYKKKPWLTFLGLLACVWLLTFKPFLGMEVVMLDVGQGDSMVIRSDNGRIYLSDCGSSSVNKVGTYRLLPFLKAKGYGRIEGIFISHLDADHYNGILELFEAAREEHIAIKNLFLPDSVRRGGKGAEEPGKTDSGEKLEELLEFAKLTNVSVVYLQAGDSVIDGKMGFFCLHPGNDAENSSDESNNGSMVLSVEYGDFSLLLTGDVEKEGEREILDRIDRMGQYDVLKVAHHGAKGSSSRAFLEAVWPKICLISCGRDNSYGHPAAETLERLEAVSSLVLQTPETGAITIRPKMDGSFTVDCFLQEGK